MKKIKRIIALIFILSFVFANSFFVNSAFALPAFPGAEGMGASTVGGRGGTVIKVTNLNDSGAGSFRAAVTASGPRIVVFDVSGHIRLTSTPITVRNPYLTIAGQTSPGGVDVSGQKFQIATHDVLVTHMRFRLSSDVCDGRDRSTPGNCTNEGDAVTVVGDNQGDAYNVVFDHCSMSWGCDETMDIGGYYGWTHDVVVSHCLIAQGLDDPGLDNGGGEADHGYGINLSSHFQDFRVTNVSMHHNYIANFRLRLPQVSYNAFADIRNNVMYNWEQRGAILMDEVDNGVHTMTDYDKTKLNAVNNNFKLGPLGSGLDCSSYASGIAYYGEAYSDCIGLNTDWGRGQFYISGNTGCANGRVWYGYSGANCTAANGYYTQRWLDQVASDYMASEAHATTDIPVTTSTMDSGLVASILADVGATKPARDSVDTGFVNDYNNTTGSTLADNHFPDNYPTFSTPAAPTDSDNDGMSDSWETANGVSSPMGHVLDANYTDLEMYLFELGGYIQASSVDEIAPTVPSGLSVA